MYACVHKHLLKRMTLYVQRKEIKTHNSKSIANDNKFVVAH